MAKPDLDKLREDFNRATGGGQAASVPQKPEKPKDYGSSGDDDKAWNAAMETRRKLAEKVRN